MESKSQVFKSKYNYAHWREDKPAEAGFSKELISADFKNISDRTDMDSLDALAFPGVDTVYKAMQMNKKKWKNHKWMGTRVGAEYQWLTYNEAIDMAENLSYGMMALDLAPQIEGDTGPEDLWRFVGIQAKNRKEWALTHIANMHQDICTVALYDTLGADATRYILDQTELSTIFISDDFIGKLAKMKIEDMEGEQKMKHLKNFVVFESKITDEDKKLAQEADITIYTMEEVIFKGKEAATAGTATINEPKPDSTFMLCYTSGTTGDPKGVKLTQKAIMGVGYAVNTRMGKKPFTEKDSYISYLPFSHSFEQAVFCMSIIYGFQCGFFAGNVLKLTEDIQVLKPTFFPSVPRLFNKIYAKIQDGVSKATGLKKMLVGAAIKSKRESLTKGKGVEHPIYDKIVFAKMKKILGGRVRFMITGSAPIAGEVLDFLKICFSCDLVEGYGMTETCAGSVTTFPGDPMSGIVGGPLQNVKIKLRDLPEMGYLSTNDPPKGEVCFWGTSIMKQYFKNPEKTAEAVSEDGWLYSGDVGMVFPNGAIKIVDRAKNIFKLSQGEYIAPEKLENVYIQSPFVAQVWMYGDSLRDFVVGFIIVEEGTVKGWASENGKEYTDALLEDEGLIKAVYKSLMDLANSNKFNSLEKPKQIVLIKEPFSVENDLMTPTFKTKRNIAKKVFEEQINTMYSKPPMKL